MGRAENPCSLTGEIYDEESRLAIAKTANNRTAILKLIFTN
jgi:hypothetical protein